MFKSITVLEYILNNDKEQNDYRNHCEENNLKPYILAENKSPSHILEYAAYALVFEYGYDLEGWLVLSNKQNELLK